MKHNPGFLALVDAARSRIHETDIAAYAKLRAAGTPHLLLDIREESEWAAGHIAGAEYLGRGILERDIETRVPDKHAMLVLYCGGGYRSALAADNLQRMGYTNVWSLDGGWRGWTMAGLPVER